MLYDMLRPSPMVVSLPIKTPYLIGTPIGEFFLGGLLRPGVLFKTPNFKRDPHAFNIKKLKCSDIKLLIVD